jgi:hypothetical protein
MELVYLHMILLYNISKQIIQNLKLKKEMSSQNSLSTTIDLSESIVYWDPNGDNDSAENTLDITVIDLTGDTDTEDESTDTEDHPTVTNNQSTANQSISNQSTANQSISNQSTANQSISNHSTATNSQSNDSIVSDLNSDADVPSANEEVVYGPFPYQRPKREALSKYFSPMKRSEYSSNSSYSESDY